MNTMSIASGVLRPFVDAPVWAVLLLKATTILLVAWLAHLALKRANARWRVFLWRVTAVGLTALPAVAWLLPALPIHVQPSSAKQGVNILPSPAGRGAGGEGGVVVDGQSSETIAAPYADQTLVDSMATGKSGSETAPNALTLTLSRRERGLDFWPALTTATTKPVLLLVWLGGIAILVFRLSVGQYRIRRVIGRAKQPPQVMQTECVRVAEAVGCPRRVELLQSADISAPFLCGLGRPLLLLPARMCDDSYRQDLPGILAHELTHVRSHDILWNVGLQLTSIVLWFHPLVWHMRKAHLAACELVCDAASANFVGNVADYCRTLARVAVDACRSLPAAGIAMARTSAISGRLNVLKSRVFHLPLPRRSLLGFGLAALLAVTVLGMLQFALAAPPAAKAVTAEDKAEAKPVSSDGSAPRSGSIRVSAADATSKPIPEAKVKVESHEATFLAESVVLNDQTSVNRQLAWNRDDKYVPPDFDGYFAAEDRDAAKRLDDFLSSQQLRAKSPDEFLDVVRRGLRSTKRHKTQVLSLVGNTFIWNRSPQNPQAIELMYHACGTTDPEVVHFAMYHGPTVVVDRSDNLIRMLMLLNDKFDGEIQERIHWGLKTYGDKKRTASQLAKLLDEHEQIGVTATLAAYSAYKRLTGEEPPHPERFAHLGLWVIGFRHRDTPARNQDGPDVLRRILREDLKTPDDKVVDFVGRIDGDHWVGVAMVSGLAEKERLVELIKSREPFALDFVEPLNERLFQTRRLGEFAIHWPQPVPNAKPAYTSPELDAVYAWEREDRYEAPDFAKFFPDDEAAGNRLDELFRMREKLALTDRELLDAFQQGLRRSSVPPNQLFGWFAGAIGWPSDRRQTEIFYHAADPTAPQAIRYNSIYFGLGTWWKKSDNVLRLFARILVTEPYDRSLGHNLRSQILWSVRNHNLEKQFLAERIAETLGKHRDLDFLTLIALDGEYHELTGSAPPNRREYAERGAFLVTFRRAGVQSEEQLKNHAAPRFASSKYWLAFVTKSRKGEISGTAVVRGLAGMEWLVGELQKDKANMIDGLLPLAHQSIEGTDFATIPEFKPFIVDSDPTVEKQ